MTTRFLTALNCKVCGQPMKLHDEDGGFTGGWSEEDERGNTVAQHWSRMWVCGCGILASEDAIDENPFSDDPHDDYLMPDGMEWFNSDLEPLDDDDVPLPPEFQQEGYTVTTENGNTAHVLVSPEMSPEGWAALNKMIDAAARGVEDGTIGKKKPDEGAQ